MNSKEKKGKGRNPLQTESSRETPNFLNPRQIPSQYVSSWCTSVCSITCFHRSFICLVNAIIFLSRRSMRQYIRLCVRVSLRPPEGLKKKTNSLRQMHETEYLDTKIAFFSGVPDYSHPHQTVLFFFLFLTTLIPHSQPHLPPPLTAPTSHHDNLATPLT